MSSSSSVAAAAAGSSTPASPPLSGQQQTRKRKADDTGGLYPSPGLSSDSGSNDLDAQGGPVDPWECRDCPWMKMGRKLDKILESRYPITKHVNSDKESSLYSRMHKFVEETWSEPWHTNDAFDKLYGIMKQCDEEKESEPQELSRKAVCRCIAALCKLRFPTAEDPWNEEGDTMGAKNGGDADAEDELEGTCEDRVLEVASTALRQTSDKSRNLDPILGGIEFQLRMRHVNGLDASTWAAETVEPLLQKKLESHSLQALLGMNENDEHIGGSYSRSVVFLLLKHALRVELPEPPSPDGKRVEFCWNLLKHLSLNRKLEHFTESMSLDLLLALANQTYRYTENKQRQGTNGQVNDNSRKQSSTSFSLTMTSVAFSTLPAVIDNIISLCDSVIEETSALWSGLQQETQRRRADSLREALLAMFNLGRTGFNLGDPQERSPGSLLPSIWDEFLQHKREYLREPDEGFGKYHSRVFHCKLLLALVDLLLGLSADECHGKAGKAVGGMSTGSVHKLITICSRTMKRATTLTTNFSSASHIVQGVLGRIKYSMRSVNLSEKAATDPKLHQLMSNVCDIGSHYLDSVGIVLVFANSVSYCGKLNLEDCSDPVICFCFDLANSMRGNALGSESTLPVGSPGTIATVFHHIQRLNDVLSFSRLMKYVVTTLSHTGTSKCPTLRTLTRGCGSPVLQIKPLLEEFFFGGASTPRLSIEDISVVLFCCTFADVLSCHKDEKFFSIDESAFQKITIVVPALHEEGSLNVLLGPGFYNSEQLFPFLSDPDIINSVAVDDLVKWSLFYAVLGNVMAMVAQVLVGVPWLSAGEEYVTAKIATNPILRHCIASWLRSVKSFKTCKSMVLTKVTGTMESASVRHPPPTTTLNDYGPREEEEGLDSSITEVSERRRKRRVSSRYRNLEGGRAALDVSLSAESRSVGETGTNSTHAAARREDESFDSSVASEQNDKENFAVKQTHLGVWISYLNVVERTVVGGLPCSMLVSSLFWLSYVSQMRADSSNDDSFVDDIWKVSPIASCSNTGRTASMKSSSRLQSILEEIRYRENTANSQYALLLHSAFLNKVGDLTQIELVDWLVLIYSLLRAFDVSPVNVDSCVAEASTIWKFVSRPPFMDVMWLSPGELDSLVRHVNKAQCLEHIGHRQSLWMQYVSASELSHQCFLVPWLWAQIEPLLEQLHFSREEEALRSSMITRDTVSAREHNRKVEEMKRRNRRSEMMEDIELARKQGQGYASDHIVQDNGTTFGSAEERQENGGTSPRVIEALLLAQCKIIQHCFQCIRITAATKAELVEYSLDSRSLSGTEDSHCQPLLHSLASMTEAMQTKTDSARKLFEKYVIEYHRNPGGNSFTNGEPPKSTDGDVITSSTSLFTDPERSHARWCFGMNRGSSASKSLDSCTLLEANSFNESRPVAADAEVIGLSSDSSVANTEVPLIKPKTTYAQVGKSMEQQMREASSKRCGDEGSENRDELVISSMNPLSFWCAFLLENPSYVSQLVENSANTEASSASDKFVTVLEDLLRVIATFPVNHSHACLAVVDVLSALRITAEDCLQDAQKVDKILASTLFHLAGSPLAVSLDRPFRISDKLERTYDLRLENLPFLPCDVGAAGSFRSQQRCVVESVLHSPYREDSFDPATEDQQVGISGKLPSVDPLWINAIRTPTSRFVWQHREVSWLGFFVPPVLPVSLQHKLSFPGGDVLLQPWANGFLTRATGNFITTGILSTCDSTVPSLPRNTVSTVAPQFFYNGCVGKQLIGHEEWLRRRNVRTRVYTGDVVQWSIRSSFTPGDFDLWPVKYALYSSLSLVGTSAQLISTVSVAHALAVALNRRIWQERSPLQLPQEGQASTFRNGISVATLQDVHAISSCLDLGGSEIALFHWCSSLESWETQMEMLLKVAWTILLNVDLFVQPNQTAIDEIILNTILGIGTASNSCLGLMLKHGLHSPLASGSTDNSDQGLLHAFQNERFVQVRRALSLLQLLYSMAFSHAVCEDCADSKFGDTVVQLTEKNVEVLVSIFQEFKNAPKDTVVSVEEMQRMVMQNLDLIDLIGDLSEEGAKEHSKWHSFEPDRLSSLGNHAEKIGDQIINMAGSEQIIENAPTDCEVPSWQELCCIPTYYTEESDLAEVSSTLPALSQEAIPELGGSLADKNDIIGNRLHCLKWRRLLAFPNIFDPWKEGEAIHREIAHAQVNRYALSVCETPLGRILIPLL
eukprot:gb/GECG01002883.1/.p1 GENE.gb/GECG01002883.1/~~gb/GECG01002883.1/.p1  ORF type:complete len:2211 (+),score=242.90 gb/GECG01002883.1/:1-6633(+)